MNRLRVLRQRAARAGFYQWRLHDGWYVVSADWLAGPMSYREGCFRASREALPHPPVKVLFDAHVYQYGDALDELVAGTF